MTSLVKEAISASVFPFKTRKLRRPLKITTLLKKLGANPTPPPPSPVAGTKGAGGFGAPVAPKPSTGLTPPAPPETTTLQRNLLAQSSKPGRFTGFTTKTRLNQAGSLGRLGVPPAVSAPNVRLASLKIAAGAAAPAPAIPPPGGRSFMPGASGAGAPPPPPPVTTGGGPPFPESGGSIPAPQPSARPPAVPASSGGIDWSGFKAPDPTWVEKGLRAADVAGVSTPIGGLATGAQLASLGRLSGLAGAGLRGVASAAWAPVAVADIGVRLGKDYILRTQGKRKPGEVIVGNKGFLPSWMKYAPGLGMFAHEDVQDEPQSQGEFLQRAGFKSLQEFKDAWQADPNALLGGEKAPYVIRLAAYHGLIPGGGTSMPTEVALSGEEIPGAGMTTGEFAAWQKIIEKGTKEQEQLLEEYQKMSGVDPGMTTTASFNPAAIIKATAVVDRSPARAIKAAALCHQLLKVGAVRPMEKGAQWWRWLLGGVPGAATRIGRTIGPWGLLRAPGAVLGGAALGGLGAASAITPSEQTVPGVGALGRLGLGALGAYGGWQAANALDLPWWAKPFAALAGSQIVPGVAGSIMGGGQPGGGLGNIMQNPLLWGGGMYLAAQNPKVQEWLKKNLGLEPWHAAIGAGLLGPSVGQLATGGQGGGGPLGGLLSSLTGGGSPGYQ